MSQLGARLKVAAWGIPLAVGLVFWGGWAFALFISLLCILAQIELYKLINGKGLASAIAVVWGGSLPLVAMIRLELLLDFVAIGALLVMLTAAFEGLKNLPRRFALTVSGIIYPSLFLTCFIPLRQAEWNGFWGTHLNGTVVLIFILSSIWICDTAAYLGGKALGKHKLAPTVSPNKTWEGFFLGFLGVLIWGAFFSFALTGMLNFGQTLVCSIIVGTIGQMGDLAESALKRSAGVKDSGVLLGPHGGILDRFDSLIVVAPAFFFYFKLTGII